MTTGTVESRLRDFIVRTDNVSFAELSNHFGDLFRDGDFQIEIRDNLVLWSGMTEEAAAAMSTLYRSGVITYVPSSWMIYLIDGRAMRLPIAKRLRPYKKPHWLPVVIRPADRIPPTRRRP